MSCNPNPSKKKRSAPDSESGPESFSELVMEQETEDLEEALDLLDHWMAISGPDKNLVANLKSLAIPDIPEFLAMTFSKILIYNAAMHWFFANSLRPTKNEDLDFSLRKAIMYMNVHRTFLSDIADALPYLKACAEISIQEKKEKERKKLVCSEVIELEDTQDGIKDDSKNKLETDDPDATQPY